VIDTGTAAFTVALTAGVHALVGGRLASTMTETVDVARLKLASVAVKVRL